MNVFLFPGQGSQIVGMGKEFYNNYKIVKEIFKKADEKLNYSISKLILNGPEDELLLTKNTQPAILTVSYSIFKVLKDEFKLNFEDFKFFAGHSLGEYSALVCADSLDFADAIYLLHERGKAMQEAVPIGKGKMIAILGTPIKNIIDLVNKRIDQNGICEIANDNAEGQVIISGDKKNIEAFEKELKQNKIKFIPLKVSAPFHCSLMKKAAENMEKKILNTKFNKPQFQIINNVNALPEVNSEDIKRLLVKQIFSTVKWRQTLLYMSNNGVTNFIEIGPGKVLSGMAKRTIKKAKCFSINSIADIKNLENELKK